MSHPIENIMHSSMEHIKALADVNTVIGDPLMTDDSTMILPVSKVSLGMLVGGGEYIAMPPNKKSSIEIEANAAYPFVGTSMVGMSLTPLAFLAVKEDSVRVLPAKQECPTDRLVDLVPQLIDTAERLLRDITGSCAKDECKCGGKRKGRDNAERAAEQAEKAAEKAYEAYEKADAAAESAAEAAYLAAEAGPADD